MSGRDAFKISFRKCGDEISFHIGWVWIAIIALGVWWLAS